MPLLIGSAVLSLIVMVVGEILRRKVNNWLDEREKKKSGGGTGPY